MLASGDCCKCEKVIVGPNASVLEQGSIVAPVILEGKMVIAFPRHLYVAISNLAFKNHKMKFAWGARNFIREFLTAIEDCVGRRSWMLSVMGLGRMSLGVQCRGGDLDQVG